MNAIGAPAYPPAPALDVSGWLNTATDLTLETMQGRVVLLHAFQMLCPGCVSHGLPQASAAFERFGSRGLMVLGLHTVFEHHAVMGRQALEAFVHEYRLRFPIAIDRHAGGAPVPTTMQRYGLQGTPSLVLIDRQGRIRLSHFGRLDDMLLGSFIGGLLAEGLGPVSAASDDDADAASGADAGCAAGACRATGEAGR